MAQPIALGISDFRELQQGKHLFVDKSALLRDLIDQGILTQLTPSEAATFQAVLEGRADQATLEDALLNLSRHLHRIHGERVLVLLDEYDTPLNTAHLKGYYDPALTFFRNLLSSVLKDNVYLHKGILTGVLRLAKDSIFTGLNNITVSTLLSKHYATAFGFTQAEVADLLLQAGLSERLAEVQRWYNGYLFGGQVIYNPCSVLSFLREEPEFAEPYWASTSTNDLVRELLLDQGHASADAWTELLGGGAVERPLLENVALRELAEQPDLLWSVLVFSGYLKVLSRRQLEDGSVLGLPALPSGRRRRPGRGAPEPLAHEPRLLF